MSAARPDAFVCDEMLGKLARDLRALGYDTAYLRDVTDEEVLATAERGQRWVLSRDRQLVDRAMPHALWIASLDPAEQLEQVVGELALRPSGRSFLSRCLECNGELDELATPPPEMPDDVADRRSWRCGDCRKVYWHGSHVEDMSERLGHYLDDPGAIQKP